MKARVSPGVLSKIAKRHDNIPQDALPGVQVEAAVPVAGGEARKERQVSVKFATCPDHAPNPKKPLTGLVAVSVDVYAFRDHTKRVGKHVVPCPGSGRIWEGETE